MTISPMKTLTFQEYLEFCETSRDRYELVHGKLQLMTPPSCLHFLIADFLATAFKQEIANIQQSWIALQGAGQQTTADSSRLPDVSVVPMDLIVNRLEQTAVLTEAAVLVVESRERNHCDSRLSRQSAGISG
jgi:Uma2 family endonuclease